jgi:hypothetical protein
MTSSEREGRHRCSDDKVRVGRIGGVEALARAAESRAGEHPRREIDRAAGRNSAAKNALQGLAIGSPGTIDRTGFGRHSV